MNRKQRVKMIVQILLMPFTRNPFDRQDLLLKYAKTCQNLQDHKGPYSTLIRNNEKARNMLINSLVPDIQPDRLGEVAQLLEKFYPSIELTKYLDVTRGEGLEGYYFNVLLNLSTELITLRDGKVSIKMWETPNSRDEFFPDSSGLYKVELWSEISRVVTPDVLIAAYFVRCGIENVQYLRCLPDNIFLSDTIFSQISRKGLAETHLHLSAGMSYQSVWEAVTDLSAQRLIPQSGLSAYQKQQRQEQTEHGELIIVGWLRLIIAKYLEAVRKSESDEDITSFYMNDTSLLPNVLEYKILNFILHGKSHSTQELLADLMAESDHYSAILRDRFHVTLETSELDILSRGLYCHYRGLQTAPETLLLFFALGHIQKFPEHSGFQRIFLCYLRIKNEYFSHKMQSTGMSGLTFFREYFAKATSSLYIRRDRDAEKRKLAYQAAFRTQFHCTDLEKLEVKLAPPSLANNEANGGVLEYRFAIIDQLIEVLDAFQTVLDESRSNQSVDEHVPTLGLVYHLIRGNIHRPPGDMCWLVESSSGPGDIISTIRRQSISFVEGLQYLLRMVPHLSEYVVGLDVASEELYAEPWVYAPVYRKARNRYNTYPIQLGTGNFVQNIGFTYHVGEDYHHVISGLRHIDEVLTYFGYKAGDRLGHGLALQVDLEEWAHNNEVTVLPKMEYLEDLLWLWSLCSEAPSHLLKYMPGLEKEIMELASELYCNVKGLNPHILCSAYKRKFLDLDEHFCRQMESLYLLPTKSSRLHSTPHRLSSQRSFCARVWQDSQALDCPMTSGDLIWDEHKLLLTHYCPVYEHCYQQPHFVFTNADKLALYQVVQEHMRQKVQHMGVYVETNPTSNLLIGDIRSLQEYPIDTLNDRQLQEIGHTAVLISVNSDDPLIFTTNVENELALVYHILLYRGIAREQVIAWIDKVRKYGLNSSFIRSAKGKQRQKEELGEIIDCLKQLRKELMEGCGLDWNL